MSYDDQDWLYRRKQHQDDDEWSDGVPTSMRERGLPSHGTKDGQALLVTVEEAARLLGIGRTTMFGLIGTGEVKSVRLGKRRLISRKSLEQFVEGLSLA
jgi:excisionase family DNA binding protein